MPLTPPTKAQTPSASNIQLDPYNVFKLKQNSIDVGWVYVKGPSRTNSVEHWLLYKTLTSSAVNKAVYAWPGTNPKQVELQFLWVDTLDENEASNISAIVAAKKRDLEKEGVESLFSITATCKGVVE
jgi:hypothetical protein